MARPFPPCPGVRHAVHDVATGVRLHVAEAGPPDGPPVVLQHGWPQHWWCWRGVIPTLAAAGHRVIAPDLRGAGWSDAPAAGYAKEQLAEDALALLDALGLGRVAWVGHDWGGWIGQLLALRAPERVARLVLCNIAPVWPPEEPLRSAANAWRFAYQLVGLPRLGPAVLGSRALHRAFPGVPPDARREFVAAAHEPGRPEAGSQLYRTFARHELVPLARGRYAGARLRMPVLVLHGLEDPVIRPFHVAAFRHHADAVELAWVPGAGHFVVDERPALVAERVLAFLA